MEVDMSAKRNTINHETLFSFEILVEYIRIKNVRDVSNELALGLRLLDFPTLIVYQPEQSDEIPRIYEHFGNDKGQQEESAGPPSRRLEHAFNTGKSCLFKINLDTLQAELSNTPLYAMVLDVKDEIPKLVGTSSISLAHILHKIRLDVSAHGISIPSSHGENRLVDINLKGDEIGSMSLKYKLLSLGTSLLPHILGKKVHVISSIHEKEQVHLEQSTCFEPPSHVDSGPRKSSKLVNSGLCENLVMGGESNQLYNATRMSSNQTNQSAPVEYCPFEQNLDVFCPPRLFYCSSGESTPTIQGVDENILRADLEAFTIEDEENRIPRSEGPSASGKERNRANSKSSQKQETTGLNLDGESLRQLPILNALLAELSQLNGQSFQQPFAIHPNLAWIYKSSAVPPIRESTSPTAQTPLLNKSKQMASPRLQEFLPSNKCSTPQVGPVSKKQKNPKCSNTSARKTLTYGTTKTYCLRLKQITPGQVKLRQCMETQSSEGMGDRSINRNQTIKQTRRKKVLNLGAGLDGNVETIMNNITVESGLNTINMDQSKHAQEILQMKISVGNDSHKSSEHSDSEANMKLVCVPSAEHEEDANSVRKAHLSVSTQTQPQPDRSTDDIENTGHRRLGSPKSTRSSSSRGRREEEQYVDDFNSLDPSEGHSLDPADGLSPDPLSSPEPPVVKTRKSFACGDASTSEGARGRPVFPTPVVAHSSPQRSLRGTHIIRPRHQVSALSLSSDNDDGDGSAYLSHNMRSRKHTWSYDGSDRSSVAESLRLSRGHRSDSAQNCVPARGFSADSAASYESHAAEELQDELGSLDLKINYQHISELVAKKLPGYTL